MNTRTIKKISLDDADGHVIIQFMGQSQAIEAKVLELKRGDDGAYKCRFFHPAPPAALISDKLGHASGRPGLTGRS
ncbi:MAG: hypothetical protein Q7U57_08010 [Methylovulum sp.]|nr:hypothetical protein [Methylovulum sp.]